MTNVFRRRLLASTLYVGAAGLSVSAMAQTAMPAADDSTADASAAEDIIVTGSLITNANLEASSPVSVVGKEELELRQVNVAEEVLRDLPGNVPSIGSAVNNGSGGSAFVDLRGLGINRNIVLLDGARVVPSNLAGIFDLNNIPLALVERIDVLTGGASTTYGADAISGVVNFITKSDFAGVEISASDRITERGDGNFFRADVTIGANFDDGRGNAVFSVGYQQSDPVYQGDRDYSIFQVNSQSGGRDGSGTTVPSRFTLGTAAGTARRQINASGALVPTFATFNFNPYNVFQTPFERFNIYGAGRYEIADGLEVYTQGLFSKNEVRTIAAPTGVFDIGMVIPLSNPYMNATTRNAFCGQDTVRDDPANPASIGVQRLYTQAVCDAAATATNPNDPNYRTVSTNLQRRTTEFGSRIDTFTTQVFNYKVGVSGGITDTISFDVFGSYGQSENRRDRENYILTSRVRQALLATNPTTCLTNTNGCVPINVFGPEGSINAAQVQYLRASTTSAARVSLAQARGVIKGDFGATIPWAADPINFAVGTEYRKYTAQVVADVAEQTPGEVGGSGGAITPVKGGYDVAEFFGELIAPIVADKPFFESLTLEGGFRRSHYEIDAPGKPSFNTTTYKLGGSWEPISSLKIRGAYSRASRAPNIGELFTPLATGLTNLGTDPCAGAAPTTNANLRAICLAQGAPVNSIGAIQNPTAAQANITAGGNLNLKPEKADTYTIGVVIQPDFIKNLAITLDYYNIALKDAITAPTPGDLITACFGSNTTAPPANAALPACTSIRRNPTTGGLDGDPGATRGLFAQLSNAGRIKTSGIDLGVNYSTDIGFAMLKLAFNGNYTRESKFQATPTSINRECVGYYSVNCGSPGSPVIGSIQPKFSWNQRTTLSFDNIDVSLLWRHINKVKFEPLQFADDLAAAQGAPVDCPDPLGADPGGCVVDPAFRKIGARDYFDLSARFSATENVELTFTVQNLLDKDPPVVGNTIGSTTFNSGNTYPSTYDALGRRFAVGAKLKF